VLFKASVSLLLGFGFTSVGIGFSTGFSVGLTFGFSSVMLTDSSTSCVATSSSCCSTTSCGVGAVCSGALWLVVPLPSSS